MVQKEGCIRNIYLKGEVHCGLLGLLQSPGLLTFCYHDSGISGVLS